jgi:hypothetical protein
MLHKNDYFIGRTGHEYIVTKDNFRHVFLKYLQSFEFALLVDVTLSTKEVYNDLELIGHSHH